MVTEFLISRRKPSPEDERRLRVWHEKLERTNVQIAKLGPLPKDKNVEVQAIDIYIYTHTQTKSLEYRLWCIESD